jgi:hypothetical protein
VDGFLGPCRERLCVTQGVPCADASSRLVGAEEDSENTDGPAAWERA